MPIAVIETDLAAAAGYLTSGGFWFPRAGDVWTAPTKAEAVKAARAIDWPSTRVDHGHTRFRSKVWVLHAPGGGFLTPAGYARLLSATHTTTTSEVPGEMRVRSKSNGRTFMKRDYHYWWRCSCGEVGSGHDRESVRRRAAQHRADRMPPESLES